MPSSFRKWNELNQAIVGCERCPRLRDYCLRIAREKRRAYQDWDYWGLPVPNFGDPAARLLIVGLAPAAHGANRTGRMFSGDRSGDFLYRALFKAGFANQPSSQDPKDNLQLIDCAITATCHCAPPDNRPTTEEIENCREWFDRTVDLLPVKVHLALGQIGWGTVIRAARRRGWLTGSMPQFGHGAVAALRNGQHVAGCYHPSQQNTFTGRLTESMLDNVLAKVRELLSPAQG